MSLQNTLGTKGINTTPLFKRPTEQGIRKKNPLVHNDIDLILHNAAKYETDISDVTDVTDISDVSTVFVEE